VKIANSSFSNRVLFQQRIKYENVGNWFLLLLIDSVGKYSTNAAMRCVASQDEWLLQVSGPVHNQIVEQFEQLVKLFVDSSPSAISIPY